MFGGAGKDIRLYSGEDKGSLWSFRTIDMSKPLKLNINAQTAGAFETNYKIGEVAIDDLFVDLWTVVKTPNGISILKKCEYFICNEDTNILYEGSYKACRDFIKV